MVGDSTSQNNSDGPDFDIQPGKEAQNTDSISRGRNLQEQQNGKAASFVGQQKPPEAPTETPTQETPQVTTPTTPETPQVPVTPQQKTPLLDKKEGKAPIFPQKATEPPQVTAPQPKLPGDNGENTGARKLLPVQPTTRSSEAHEVQEARNRLMGDFGELKKP